MPRITVAGGASNPDALPGEVGYVEPEAAAEAEPEFAFEGEHGPEPVELPAPHEVLPEGWSSDPGPRAGGEAPNYEAMNKSDLIDEAKARKLPVSGTKADLAARLAEHDAAVGDA